MPAVKPEKLEAQVDEVVLAFDEPGRLVRRCTDLVEFYASRVRTTGRTTRAGSVRSLDVPASVLGVVERRLQEAAAADRHAGAMAAEALWKTPFLETRLLAIGLLVQRPIEDLVERVSAWASTADDDRLLDRLASGPLLRLLRISPDRFWSAVEEWFGSRAAQLAGLAWLALAAAIPELDPADLPRALEAMEKAPPAVAGGAWRGRVGAFVAASRQESPGNRALPGGPARGGTARGALLARQLLSRFPAAEQAALRDALRRRDLP